MRERDGIVDVTVHGGNGRNGADRVQRRLGYGDSGLGARGEDGDDRVGRPVLQEGGGGRRVKGKVCCDKA